MHVVVCETNLGRRVVIRYRIEEIQAAVVGVGVAASENATEDRVFVGDMLIDLHDQAMLIDFGALLPVEVVIDGVVRCDRKALQNRLRDFAQAGEATRNNVAGEWVSNLIRVSIGTNDIVNRKRIIDLSLIDRTAGRVSHRLAIDSQLWSERLRKVSTPVRRGERGERCVVRTRTVFEACVVHKEESLIATVVELGKAHRAAESSAKLVLLERRLLVC